MARRVLALAVTMAAVLVLPLGAARLLAIGQDKAAARDEDKVDSKSAVEDLAIKQERMQRLFSDFKGALLRLSQRLAVSPRPEDQEKAKVLKLAIEKANEEGVENSFDKLVAMLKDSKAVDLGKVDTALTENKELTGRIRAILALLLTDNRDEQLRREREATQRRLEELKRIIREQENARTRTELARAEKDQLAKEQGKITGDTDALAKGNSKGDAKGDGKKGDGKKGDQKGDGKDGKKSDGKDGQKGDGKKGDGKDGQKGDGKDGKKDDQKGDQKGDGKDGKKGDQKGDQKGDGKDGKKSDGKDGQKGGQQSGKQGDQQDGQKGSPQSGQQQDQQQDFPGRKQIQDATQDQREAQKKIEQGQNDQASNKQDDAVKKLKEAQKKLEDLLRQLREEEIERILAALQMRCERMLAMQIEVRDGTVGLDKVIKDRPDKRADNADKQRGYELSDKEEVIVKEANDARRLLQSEGSAVAFPVVLDNVVDDMTAVSRRLRATDSGTVTVAIENDIIDTLKEMIDALKKARQENQKRQPPPGGGGGGMPGNQPLIEELQELKMIRNMQLRVNSRTETYGKEYQGEQAPDPTRAPAEQRDKVDMLHKELKSLADRQEKIFEVTNNLYRGKNK